MSRPVRETRMFRPDSASRRWRRRSGLCLLCLCAMALTDAGTGHAQDATAPEEVAVPPSTENVEAMPVSPAPSPWPIQFSLTSSGGVSLGAYQAGYLYYLSEVIKMNPELFRLRVVTGSSAGTINSLITAISLGNDVQSNPRESLFFKVWSAMSINKLLDVADAPPLALSSRDVMEELAGTMEAEWNRGLRSELDIVIGATATRVKSRTVSVAGSFSVPRQEEKFVFRIQGRGRGNLPAVSNYVDQAHGIPHPILPFSGGRADAGRSDFSILKKLMFASSAFPLAFPAEELEFCMTTPAQKDIAEPMRCDEPTERELFVDGSMFDRNPLGLAHRISQAGLQDVNGEYVWRDMPDGRVGRLPDNFNLLYLDVMNESYPTYKPEEVYRRIEALFPSFGSYSQGFVRSSQAKEIYMLLDHNPEIRDRIYLTERSFPTASGLLFNFFGFFEQELRTFDFYLGMHDAHEYLVVNLARALRREGVSSVDIALPEMTESALREDSWNPYFCMRSELDGISRYRDRCDGRTLRDFRILLQVSMNRLYDMCSVLSVDESVEHTHCLNAMYGRRPPVIQKLPEGNAEDDWKRGGDETNFQYTLRMLEQYGFHFRDLGLDRDEAWIAMSRIRELLAGALDDYAKKLPPAESIVIRVLGKPALNFFKYQPPQAIIYAGAGKGAEWGMSLAGRYTPSRWIRFNFALQFKGLYDLLSPSEKAFAMTPLAGLEIENTRWSGAVLQARLGVRVGYQFTTGDRFTTKKCRVDDFPGDSNECSAPVGQVFLAFSFYERLRLQGGLEWFPYFLPPMTRNEKNVWNGFLEVCWQWISPF